MRIEGKTGSTMLPVAAMAATAAGPEPQSLADTALTCQEYVESLGYRFFFFSFHLPLVPLQPSVFALTNYPREWFDLYRDRGYARVDPVTQQLKRAMYPFTWSTAAHALPAVRELFAAARQHGLDEGVCVPLYGPRGARAALTVAGRAVPRTAEALERQYAELLHFGLRVFRDVMNAMGAQSATSESTGLTARQQQILTGIAEGLSYGDIGERYGIKPSTVKTLLDRCCQKLGVATREQAIVIAMASGQIHPVTNPSSFALQEGLSRHRSFYVRPRV